MLQCNSFCGIDPVECRGLSYDQFVTEPFLSNDNIVYLFCYSMRCVSSHMLDHRTHNTMVHHCVAHWCVCVA